ncbi:MAG: hypothetical protein MJE66_11695 [Proteobacteria bacterium]|nr:hypothetical protein [Pseudomonadota bacterium]
MDPALKRFRRFLSEEMGVPAQQLPEVHEATGHGDTLGALGLRMGVLTLTQIERVVDVQLCDGNVFGEIAVKLGFLDPGQVERLLWLQRSQRCLDLARRPLLAGQVTLPDLLAGIAEFLRAESDFNSDPRGEECSSAETDRLSAEESAG